MTVRLMHCADCGHAVPLKGAHCRHCGTLKSSFQRPLVLALFAVGAAVATVVAVTGG